MRRSYPFLSNPKERYTKKCISVQYWVENHITCPILKRDTGWICISLSDWMSISDWVFRRRYFGEAKLNLLSTKTFLLTSSLFSTPISSAHLPSPLSSLLFHLSPQFLLCSLTCVPPCLLSPLLSPPLFPPRSSTSSSPLSYLSFSPSRVLN